MTVCPACLAESAEGSRFCSSCGQPLAAPPVAAARVEERKVVSVLFCDLVGFTAASEQADPEDVGRMLDAYAAMAHGAIRRHGGVVEKFIGDAVVGVFGVPTTHEDDALRAVRAGLEICEAAAATDLRLRVGVNSGEALVRLDITPESGERFMTGDAVNTASRIQSIAPELGVAAGEATWRATRHGIDYEPLPPATLKGKAGLVPVFQATGLHATTPGDPQRSHGGVHAGRVAELDRLVRAFDRSASERRPQIVLVSGEPGIGKSRLIAELRLRVEDRYAPIVWRQGRCLPYGDGVTFWALGEIVKAHAGILDGDDPAIATAKLEAVVPDVAERDWLRARLLPLIGVTGAGQAPARAEAFAAWRIFLASLAAAGPAIVVFEDLHWADDAFLDFMAGLEAGLAAVSVLVVATARPELFARAAGAHALPGIDRIDLAPLADEDAATIVADLLGARLPPELRATILDRAEGNPLFAEEYVRLLTDRGLLITTEGSVMLAEGASLPVPDTIGALLAARLDTLPRPRKALLSDASVVGQVFWAGTVAAMGDRDREAVVDDLAHLARLEFVRPVEPSSMADETESAFWHALGRDVAYAQLPRAARASRHVAAARWLEAKAGDRVGDIAELLAHHYTTAHDLAEAAGDADLASATRSAMVRFLLLAGDRALGLDTAKAVAAYDRAIVRMPAGDPSRASALQRLAIARFQAGEHEAAVSGLTEALEALEAAGDDRQAAATKLELVRALQWAGRPQWSLVDEAVMTLERFGPTPELLEGLARLAFVHMLADRIPEAIGTADRAIELAAQNGLAPPPSAYAWRGAARSKAGDAGGLEDLRTAVDLATTAGHGRDAANFRNEYSTHVFVHVGAHEGMSAVDETIAFARARGLAGVERFARGGRLEALLDLGILGQAVDEALSFRDDAAAAGHWVVMPTVWFALSTVAWLRGDLASASQIAATLETVDIEEIDQFYVARAARIHAESGDRRRAMRLVRLIDDVPANSTWPGSEVCDAVSAAIALRDVPLARRLIARPQPPVPYMLHIAKLAEAHLAEAEGDPERAAAAFAEAAAGVRSLGIVPQEGEARLGLGRCLVALGRPRGAGEPLLAARDIGLRIGAPPLVSEAEALLAGMNGAAPGIETPAG